MLDLIVKCIKKPRHIFIGLSRRNLLDWMPDEMYLKIVYFLTFKKKLDLQNPKTYNEKLQWIKLYDRNPKYVDLVDKYKVKKIIAEMIGEEYIIPTIGVWERAEDIDFNTLPEKFVLKCNHDSGGIVICKDKKALDKEGAVKKLSNCLKHNGFWYGREWPYKNVKPCIIAEHYMEDSITHDLRDYKFFAFSGEVKAMFVASDRFKEEDTKFDFFDQDFNHLNFLQGHPNALVPINRPKTFEKMKELAEIISANLYQSRIDFYEVNGKIYFGEITFFHYSGFTPFEPSKWDNIFGEWIHLPR